MGNRNSDNRTHRKYAHAGRPYPANYQKMVRVCISLAPAQVKWLHTFKARERSQKIRQLIDHAIANPVPSYRVVEQRF